MSNNKNYRKYAVTTMAAAAAVASVAPVAASADAGFQDVKPGDEGVGAHYDAVVNLIDQGVIDGKDDGLFHPWDAVSRGQVAKMLTDALNLSIPSNVSGVLSVYDDVDENSDFAKYIAAVTDANVFEGNGGSFDEHSTISREQMASSIVRAFDLEKYDTGDNVNVNFDKTSPEHRDAIQTIANLEVTENADNFEAFKDISRASFASFVDRSQTAVEEGKESEGQIETGISTKTVNEDESDQQLAINFQGNSIDLDTLVNEKGYEVEFQADKDVFLEGNTSETGILDEAQLKINESFEVQLVLTKDGETTKSPKQTVNVISEVTPDVGGFGISVDGIVGSLSSNTITTSDEEVKIGKLTSSDGNVIDVSGEQVYDSSNKSVATVDTEGNIQAHAAGKTTITVTAGKEQYEQEIEVVTEDRIADDAQFDHDNIHIAKEANSKMPFTLHDQFGDQINPADYDVKATTAADNGLSIAKDVNDNKVSIDDISEDVENGSYNVYIENTDEKDNIGKFEVVVSDSNVVKEYKIDGKSSIALNGEEEYTVNAFNEDNGFLGELADAPTSEDSNFDAELADDRYGSVDHNEGESTFTVKSNGERVGSSDVVLKDNGTQVAKKNIEFVNNAVAVTDIDWTAATVTNQGVNITMENALDITELSKDDVDPIVNGVSLNDVTSSKVRIAEGENYEANELTLYLDRDDNGSQDETDTVLGTVQVAEITGLDPNEFPYETKLDDEGEIVFNFVDNTTGKPVTSTTLQVKVK